MLKKVLIFQEETSKLKKQIKNNSEIFLIFSEKHFSHKTTLKIFFISQKKVFLVFWENETLVFCEMELFSHMVKNFQEGTFRARKINNQPSLQKCLTSRLENSYTFS